MSTDVTLLLLPQKCLDLILRSLHYDTFRMVIPRVCRRLRDLSANGPIGRRLVVPRYWPTSRILAQLNRPEMVSCLVDLDLSHHKLGSYIQDLKRRSLLENLVLQDFDEVKDNLKYLQEVFPCLQNLKIREKITFSTTCHEAIKKLYSGNTVLHLALNIVIDPRHWAKHFAHGYTDEQLKLFTINFDVKSPKGLLHMSLPLRKMPNSLWPTISVNYNPLKLPVSRVECRVDRDTPLIIPKLTRIPNLQVLHIVPKNDAITRTTTMLASVVKNLQCSVHLVHLKLEKVSVRVSVCGGASIWLGVSVSVCLDECLSCIVSLPMSRCVYLSICVHV